jgi:RimJ/RimL family protein N-acetyltransferase
LEAPSRLAQRLRERRAHAAPRAARPCGLKVSDHAAWAERYGSRRAPRHRYDSGPIAPEHLTEERFQAWVKRHGRLARDDDTYVLAAFSARSGRHLGTFDLSTIRRNDNGWANIGYGIHNRFQGRGYGREGLAAMLAFGLNALGYHRIEAAVRPDNASAIACAKAAGMAHEGLRRSFWLDDDGWADHEIFVSIAP